MPTQTHDFIRRPSAIVLTVCFLLLLALNTSARADQTNKITLSTSDDSIYEFSVPATYKNVTLDKNSKVTMRALMTLHLLRIPDDYTKASETVIASADGISGSALPEAPSPQTSDFDSRGAIKNSAADFDKYKTNYDLFNAIRQIIPRDAQSNMNGVSLLAKAIGEATGNKPYFKAAQYAFTFADSLSNARAARAISLKGKESIVSRTDEVEFFDKVNKSKEIRMLTNPADIDSAAASMTTLTQNSFRDNGRWTFNDCLVKSKKHAEVGLLHMVEVNVTWAFEATFDPTSPPQIPIGRLAAPPVAAAPSAPPDAGAGGQNANATVQPSPLASGLLGQVAGFTVNQLSSFGAPGAQIPGVDVVGGFAVKDNGTPTLFGANITFTGKDTNNEIRGKLFDWSRVGAIIGRTTDQHPSYVIGPSLKLNPSTILYTGYGFSDSGGVTRSGIAFGAAFNLLSVLSGSATQTKTASQNYEIEVKNGKLIALPGAEKTNAAILWTGSSFKYATSIIAQADKSYEATFSLREHPTPNFWLQFVLPGSLHEVIAGAKITPSTEPIDSASIDDPNSWLDGKILLYNADAAATIPLAHSPEPALEAGKTYRLDIESASSPAAAHSPADSHVAETPFQPVRMLALAAPGHRSQWLDAHRRTRGLHALPMAVAALAPVDSPADQPRGGGLRGRLLPPDGVKPDHLLFELRGTRNGPLLTAAGAAFLLNSNPYSFTWSVPQGSYWMRIVNTDAPSAALWEQKVSTGTGLKIVL